MIGHGMTLQEAVEAPRIWTQGQALEVEPGITPAVRHELTVRGHDLQVVPKIAGGMNGIMFDYTAGHIYGAACWRADGAPAGLSGGPASNRSGCQNLTLAIKTSPVILSGYGNPSRITSRALGPDPTRSPGLYS